MFAAAMLEVSLTPHDDEKERGIGSPLTQKGTFHPVLQVTQPTPNQPLDFVPAATLAP